MKLDPTENEDREVQKLIDRERDRDTQTDR